MRGGTGAGPSGPMARWSVTSARPNSTNADDVTGGACALLSVLPARAAVPGTDQGAAGLARGRAHGRKRAGRSLRPLALGRPRRCQPSAGARRRSAPRSGSGAGRTERSRASAPPARPGCPASSPTARARLPGAPRSSWSRAIPPAAPPSRARNRETQAVLPLRGKILNVASASADKLRGNKELDDLGPGARLRHRRPLRRRRPPLRARRHHDRRGRGTAPTSPRC